jgi:hypothetical protein
MLPSVISMSEIPINTTANNNNNKNNNNNNNIIIIIIIVIIIIAKAPPIATQPKSLQALTVLLPFSSEARDNRPHRPIPRNPPAAPGKCTQEIDLAASRSTNHTHGANAGRRLSSASMQHEKAVLESSCPHAPKNSPREEESRGWVEVNAEEEEEEEEEEELTCWEK